jgi:RNA polymerase sigma factor (sigma-70 family)
VRHDGRVQPASGAIGPEEFRAAWPRVVRVLATWSGSLDDAEEYAAEAMSRAVAHQGAPIEDLAAWCVRVAKRARIDEHRRHETFERLAPRLTPEEASDPVDDRLALLFVACDPALAPGAQMVLALRVVCGLSIAETAQHLGIQESAAAARLTRAKKALAAARGEFLVPEADERRRRLPVVLDCVAGMFTVAHRTGLAPEDALADTGRQALVIADALVEAFPEDTEVRGLRAVVRLGLARRPARVDEDGVALTLEEMDRTLWDPALVRSGLADATLAARGRGRFALESAISGLHTSAPSVAGTDWPRILQLYDALLTTWPSPAVEVARLTARGYADPDTLAECEEGLLRLVEEGPTYAQRDAAFALADLCWRTGRREEAARRYSDLAGTAGDGAVRRFCERRAAG